MEVDLYLQASSQYLGKKNRQAGYVIAFQSSKGLVTKHGFITCDGTFHHTNIEILNHALSHIKEGWDVIVHMDDRYVVDMIRNNLDEWEEKKFLSARGKLVKDAQLWQRLAELRKGRKIICHEGNHEFTNWMISEMEKMPVDNS